MISPLHAMALCAPDAISTIPIDLLALLAYSPELWLRPDQRVPPGDWRSAGFVAGRGFGKSFGIAAEINRRVESGECTAPALIAPTTDRVAEIQSSVLCEMSSVSCPCEPLGKGVRWANGVKASAATAEIERPSSGSNFDLVWMTEIVRWNPASRMAAYEDITTACRVGPRPQILWDTTSRGKNDVIQALVKQHEAHPDVHLITRGTMFDNPMLTRNYVLSEIEKYGKGTRAYDEEILGLVFAEAAGSLWEQDWIDLYRVHDRPLSPLLTVLGLDPALSGDKSADEVGVCRATLIAGGHVYVEDLGGKMAPEDYATLVVRECRRDASGVVVERNHVGQHARDLIRVHAKLAGMRVELLPNPDKPFPPRRPGTIHIREVVSHRSKETRAAPVAALYSAGKVHHVGVLARLEHEQTTWEPGTRRSPNRLDAAVFAVGEVAHIAGPTPRNVGKSIREAAKISERLQRAGASHGRGRIGL